MLAKVFSAAILGVDAYLVDVEVDIAFGMPGVTVVGLPDAAVQESRDRVRSAIRNSGFSFPAYRVTVNMAPADTRKSGPVFDLAIALGILAASEQLPVPPLGDFVIVGELSLDGGIRSVHGVLSFALAARAAGKTHMIVPAENAREAALVEGLQVYPAQSLQAAIRLLSSPETATPFQASLPDEENIGDSIDYADVKGQSYAKRGLEIAAAGGHNLLMIGPPGSGKTMLARRLPTILPAMTFAEALETSKIYSAAGKLGAGQGLISLRPFRSPHHSISAAGLVGGGSLPRPGEISLAHHGVLFLDELLEFRREVLEVLRQPLEDRIVTISRAQQSLAFPAGFILISAMNPCMCGHRGDSLRPCTCTPSQVQRYFGKLSGPLLDRIDIHLEVPRLSESELFQQQPAESSAAIRQRVMRARECQHARFGDNGLTVNAQMLPSQLRSFCQLDPACRQILQQAMHRFNLSARSHDRILKVARTIADLEGSTEIQITHLAESLQFRTLDRQHLMAS